MAVTIGSARIDENGKAMGGRAGDQTGKEVSTQAWYKHSKGWRVIRAKNPEVRKKLAAAMKAACSNKHIGYDQGQRNTLYTLAAKVGFDISKVVTDCETDCSALVRVCVAYAAGITTLPAGFRTVNMCKYLLDTGAFVEMKGAEYTDKSDRLCAGDILCTKTSGHTVIVLTNGTKADNSAIGSATSSSGVLTIMPTLMLGEYGNAVAALQKALLAWDKGCLPKYGVDADFGMETATAVKSFQKANGLEVDGIVGEKTWEALEKYTAKTGVTITGNTVNLRSGPGTSYDIRGIAKKGDEMTFSETANVNGTTWYKTAFGWVSGRYAKVV